MSWLHFLLSLQILLLVEVGERASAAKIQLGSTDAASGGRQRRTQIWTSPAPSESDEVTSSPLKDYWFKTGVEDAERGFMQGRAETKRGDQVVGSYQYADGNVKVKVVYAADDDGYRVLKEERVTLKPFTESEEPSPVPEALPKKPKGKPRRPGGAKHRPKPHIQKQPKVKPSFHSYQSDLFQGNGPYKFTPHNTDIFSSNSPDIFSNHHANAFPGNSPDPFTFDLFSPKKPGRYPGKKPESPPRYKPDNKFTTLYGDGSEGLKLPTLESLDGYSVKLRTNHGSGYSLQGFVSNPGKPQKVKIGKNGKSSPLNTSSYGKSDLPSNETPFSSDDEFNHSLETRDGTSSHSGNPKMESRPKSKGRKTKSRPIEPLAIFVRNPPVDVKPLFKPHSSAVSRIRESRRSPLFRPSEGLRF